MSSTQERICFDRLGWRRNCANAKSTNGVLSSSRWETEYHAHDEAYSRLDRNSSGFGTGWPRTLSST
jgi:hypothetical protein